MLSKEEMRQAGLSLQKINYIKNLANYFDDNLFDFNKVKNMSNEEISMELIQIKGIGESSHSSSEKYIYNKTIASSKKEFKSILSNYKVGSVVKHSIFGKGKLLRVEGVGDNAKLTILFSGNVKKTLIQKYANLTILEYV